MLILTVTSYIRFDCSHLIGTGLQVLTAYDLGLVDGGGHFASTAHALS